MLIGIGCGIRWGFRCVLIVGVWRHSWGRRTSAPIPVVGVWGRGGMECGGRALPEEGGGLGGGAPRLVGVMFAKVLDGVGGE